MSARAVLSNWGRDDMGHTSEGWTQRNEQKNDVKSELTMYTSGLKERKIEEIRSVRWKDQ